MMMMASSSFARIIFFFDHHHHHLSVRCLQNGCVLTLKLLSVCLVCGPRLRRLGINPADPYASVGPMGSFAGLSLWLVPASDADSSTPQHSVLKHEMGALRSANAGSPAFEPHATLLAGLKGEDGWTAGKIWPVFKDGLQKWRKEQNEAAESAEGKEKWMEVGLRDVTTRGFYWQVSRRFFASTSRFAGDLESRRDAAESYHC